MENVSKPEDRIIRYTVIDGREIIVKECYECPFIEYELLGCCYPFRPAKSERTYDGKIRTDCPLRKKRKSD